MRYFSILRKCAREQIRDLWILALTLAFAPLFVLMVWAFTGGTGSTTYGVLVINQDVGVTTDAGVSLTAGADIVNQLAGLTYENGGPLLRLLPATDRADAETRLRNREAAVLIILPPDLSITLQSALEHRAPVTTAVTFVGDLTNPYYTVASILSMIAVDRYFQAVLPQNRPVEIVEAPLGASAARTEFENYVPGLLIMAVTLLMFQASMMIAREVEGGTLRRLQLTNLTALEWLGGVTTWLLLIVVAVVLLTFGVASMLGFRSAGPLWIAVVIGVITGLSVIGVGLIIACFAKTVSHAFVVANFPWALFAFLSGGMFPLPRLTLFTVAGHAIGPADILPPTHAIVALNKILTLGARLSEVTYELTMLTVLAVLYFAVGVWIFQRRQLI